MCLYYQYLQYRDSDGFKMIPFNTQGPKQNGRHLACDHVEYILLNTIFVSRFKFQFVQLTISHHWIGWRPDTEWWKAITRSNDDTCYASQGLMKYCRYINALRPIQIQSGQHLQTTYWWTLKNWICHAMEMLSALLTLYEGNPLVSRGFPSQRASNAEPWYSLMCDEIYCWINIRVVCNLRRH